MSFYCLFLGNRLSQSLSDGPTVMNSRSDGVRGDSGLCGPRGCRHRLAVKSDPHGSSGISVLLNGSRPAAVVWLIVSVVVDAIKRVFWGRTTPHVRDEIFEFLPSFANLNPSFAVFVELRMALVAASLLHVDPRHVFRRASQTVLQVPLQSKVRATTTLSFSERDGRNESCLPAITSALPVNLRSAARVPTAFPLVHHHQTKKAQTGTIDVFWHEV